MPKVGIVDVAREAGVSVGAASDALSGKNRLPEETRQRVRAVADRLGYRPDPAARALRTGRAPILGLVLTHLRRSFAFDLYEPLWGRLIGTATLTAHARDYGLCVLPDLELGAQPSVPLAGLVVPDIDPGDPAAAKPLAFGIPVAAPGDGSTDGLAVVLRFDDDLVARRALEHLWDRGSRHVGLLLPSGDLREFAAIEHGYRAWCTERGTDPRVVRVSSRDDADEAARQMLTGGLDGVYTVALGAMAVARAAAELGISLGSDFRVVSRSIGMEDVLDRLAVSSMSLQVEPGMAAVVDALVDVIEGRQPAPVFIDFTFDLVIRGSSGGTAP